MPETTNCHPEVTISTDFVRSKNNRNSNNPAVGAKFSTLKVCPRRTDGKSTLTRHPIPVDESIHSGVTVDSTPHKINAVALPKPWPSGPVDIEVSPEKDGQIVVTHPLVISGRGGATLEIIAPASNSLASERELETGLAFIGAASLGGLLLIYRKLRARIVPLSMIREGLVAIKNGETSRDVLAIRSDMGPE